MRSQRDASPKRALAAPFSIIRGFTMPNISKQPETRIVPHIRWMIRRDLPKVLEIEQLCFRDPWGEEKFIQYLRERSVIAQVAEHEEQVLGYMVYENQFHGIELHNLAVAPARQRRGVGRALVQKLIGKLAPQRRRFLLADVADYNLDAQLFFQTLGFLAKIEPDRFRDSRDGMVYDAFRFEYRLKLEATP